MNSKFNMNADSDLQVRIRVSLSLSGRGKLYFSLNISGLIWKAAESSGRGMLTLPGILPSSASSDTFLTSRSTVEETFMAEEEMRKAMEKEIARR